MEAYTDFAYVYDVFMDNTPYDKWGGLLVSRLEKEDVYKRQSQRSQSEAERRMRSS